MRVLDYTTLNSSELFEDCAVEGRRCLRQCDCRAQAEGDLTGQESFARIDTVANGDLFHV